MLQRRSPSLNACMSWAGIRTYSAHYVRPSGVPSLGSGNKSTLHCQYKPFCLSAELSRGHWSCLAPCSPMVNPFACRISDVSLAGDRTGDECLWMRNPSENFLFLPSPSPAASPVRTTRSCQNKGDHLHLEVFGARIPWFFPLQPLGQRGSWMAKVWIACGPSQHIHGWARERRTWKNRYS